MNTQLKIRAPAKALVSLSEISQSLKPQNGLSDWMAHALQNCCHHAEMAHFFRRCLPELWCGARGDTGLRAQDDVCERQDQLLRALSQRLPIWLDIGWCCESMTPGLPLETNGVDWSDFCEPEDLGHFRPAFVVLGYLAGMLDKDIADAYVAGTGLPIILPAVPQTSCNLEWFGWQCRMRHRRQRRSKDAALQGQTVEAWHDLPMAMALAGQFTGNTLLDTPIEERHLFDEWMWDLGWTRKALRIAERMSRQATCTMQAFGRAADWLDSDPLAWAQVFELWLEAHRRYAPKPPVVRTVSSQDFVSGEIFRRP